MLMWPKAKDKCLEPVLHFSKTIPTQVLIDGLLGHTSHLPEAASLLPQAPRWNWILMPGMGLMGKGSPGKNHQEV